VSCAVKYERISLPYLYLQYYGYHHHFVGTLIKNETIFKNFLPCVNDIPIYIRRQLDIQYVPAAEVLL
jgi:hypothetical protein